MARMADSSSMVRWLGLLGFVLLCPLALAAEPPCAACHRETAEAFASNVHGATGDGSCTTCHGDGIGHPGTPNAVRTFDDEPPAERSAPCKGCHRNIHPPTTSNAHDQAGVSCSDCHMVHDTSPPLRPTGFERMPSSSAVCFECHEDTFAQFAFSERHRLAEGSVSCTSCHDPHGPDKRRHLAGFKQSECATCHADAEGPFVFEHAASRVEGCSSCHVAHGSPNRHLLTHQRVGELCYSCHALVPQFHLGFSPVGAPRFDENTVCTNCHVTIHGSNLDRNFLR